MTQMTKIGELEVTAPGDREIVMTRSFNAPRQMVFDAWMKPELVARWLGAPDMPMVSCEIDPRVGGAYRFVMRKRDGSELRWGGVYREIVPPERFVATQKFDDYPNDDATVTSVFTEKGGRTTIMSTLLYGSREARDAVVKSGMAHGAAASYDRLAGLVEAQPSG